MSDCKGVCQVVEREEQGQVGWLCWFTDKIWDVVGPGACRHGYVQLLCIGGIVHRCQRCVSWKQAQPHTVATIDTPWPCLRVT